MFAYTSYSLLVGAYANTQLQDRQPTNTQHVDVIPLWLQQMRTVGRLSVAAPRTEIEVRNSVHVQHVSTCLQARVSVVSH